MTPDDPIKSEAFHRAALKSESYRVVGMLCLLAALMLSATVRGLATGERRLLLAQILVLALVTAFEWFMLNRIRAELAARYEVPESIWMLNVLVETQLPTIALFLLIQNQIVGPYEALVAPVIFLYPLVIILSTLRLSPGLSLLTGLGSALGYVMVASYYAEMKYPDRATRLAAFPRSFYLLYAGSIAICGVVAAAVAAQIRGHVAAALREAELQKELEQVNHDLDTARSIQQGLLPGESPALEHFDVAGWNQPADQTGGDYFDWQALPDGQFAISLGDATGHGIGPALVSASCRAYARASLLANGDRDSLLPRLNRLLAQDLSANRFITFAVALLDPLKSHVKVLSAGHGPILWYKHATNDIESLEAQGIPLGMIPGIDYTQGSEICLAAGDMLVLVTDGFYEWENPEGDQFGLQRLEAIIRESRDCRAEEVITRLRSAVDTFCRGTKQQDDLTAVILKRR